MKYYLLLITCISLTAQSVDKSVISTIGYAYTSQTVSVSYNAGELIIGNLTSEDGAIQLSSGYYESLNLETLHIDIPDQLGLQRNCLRKQGVFILGPSDA